MGIHKGYKSDLKQTLSVYVYLSGQALNTVTPTLRPPSEGSQEIFGDFSSTYL